MIHNRKVTALCIVHYGCEYLSTAIKAVYPIADEIVIVYTGKPSHGGSTEEACPESITDVINESKRYDPDNKVLFIEGGVYGTEGEQRGKAEEICKQRGTEIIIRFDADEVWDTESLNESLKIVAGSDAKYFGVNGFVHFWKSFNNALYDGFTPVRFINVNSESNREVVISGKIYHFSCAQSDKIMRYKYLIHGHKNEIRPDWLESVYFNWKEGDTSLHPTSFQIWGSAVPFDKNTLPDILKEHSNFNKETIN